jgi:hypothetical protein
MIKNGYLRKRLIISAAIVLMVQQASAQLSRYLINCLIGDEKKPYTTAYLTEKWPEWLLKGQPRASARYTFASSRQFNVNLPLLDWGLIGPVVQEISKKNR